MKSKLSIAGLILAMSLTLCGFFCSGSTLHKANVATKDIADALDEMETQTEAMHAEYLTCKAATPDANCPGLDKEDAKNVSVLISQSTLPVDLLAGKLATLKDLSAANSAEVVAWFSDLSEKIAELNEQGVLHIKNPDAKAKLTLAYQSLNAALLVAQNLFESVHGPIAKPSPAIAPVIKGIKFPVAPIPVNKADFTPAMLLAILAAFNGLARLIAKARANGQLTDDLLQQGVLAEDAATRNHAADFVASLDAEKS